MTATRLLVPLIALALAAAACGGSDGTIDDPLAAVPDDRVLSSCAAVGPGDAIVLVRGDGARPSVETMEAAVSGHPDARFVLDELVADGTSREDALHDVYAQFVGERLVADASALPGYVSAAYARPDVGEPFRLAFSGELPADFDADAYELGSYGLEVTTGAAGLDPDAIGAAFDAAEQVGIRTVSGSGDEVTGAITIEVIAATAEQVERWEALLDDPARVCMVAAPRSTDCDGAVVDAQQRAQRQGEVFPASEDGLADGDDRPTGDRADEVRRSYLGLGVADAIDKAEAEQRSFRTVVEDGVALATTDDLRPERLNATVCDGTVVDVRFDTES